MGWTSTRSAARPINLTRTGFMALTDSLLLALNPGAPEKVSFYNQNAPRNISFLAPCSVEEARRDAGLRGPDSVRTTSRFNFRREKLSTSLWKKLFTTLGVIPEQEDACLAKIAFLHRSRSHR